MKKIIHLDMDAFFASIEERDNPELKGKPVIVGAEPGTRGVVSTCNYIARKYGVHSAMSSAEAYRRCPSAVFVHPHFSKYKEASAEVHKIMSEYTDKIEFVSLDEGYMDVTGSEFLFGSAEGIAKEIKRRVFETLNVTCSVGVGYSMMSAKCASEEKKPNGFFVISSPEEFRALMFPRSVRELYGIGSKTAERLSLMGIKTVGQLANQPIERLKKFGPSGGELIAHANGIDNREVTPNSAPKSIGRETTFLKDTNDKNLLRDTLLLLAEDVSYRLYLKGLWCKTVTLKVKFSDMKSITRASSGKYIKSADKIYKAASDILNSQNLAKPVRLIGVTASNLTDKAYVQLSFGEDNDDKNDVLGNTVFNIKQKFGRGALKTAKSIIAEARLSDEYNKK